MTIFVRIFVNIFVRILKCIELSPRSRRSAGADPVYIYLTPLEESSGPWDEVWTPSPSGCSRRCGGGVLAETRYSVRCY